MLSFAHGLLALVASAQLAQSVIIPVTVGGTAGLKFSPSFVNATVGDVIRFSFRPKAHSVTQSTLEQPCLPAAGGFDSGFIPVADTVTDPNFPLAELTVKSNEPLWIYCRQGNHCQQGMVFAVNPNGKFDQFLAAATGGAPPPAATTTGTVPPAVTAPATTAPAPAVTNPPVTGTGTEHRVIVGGPGILAFSPSNITAQVGDTIVFEFHQKNHTVTGSSFDQPCVPLGPNSAVPAFDSGFFPVSDSVTNFPTWSLKVNDTKPIWAFCRQGNHCGQGMVFSANAVESGPKNFAAFQALAKELNGTTTTTPGYGAADRSSSSASISMLGFLTAVSFIFL